MKLEDLTPIPNDFWICNWDTIYHLILYYKGTVPLLIKSNSGFELH